MFKHLFKVRTIKYTFLIGILIIIFNLFRLEVIDLFTLFLVPFISIIAISIFYLSCLYSIFHFIKSQNKKEPVAYIPLLFNCIIFLVVTFFPFFEFDHLLNFLWYEKQRTEIIHLIDSGKIQPDKDNSRYITLPAKYKGASKGGGRMRISENHDFLLFYTESEFLDNYAGFVYSVSDEPPDSRISSDIVNTAHLQPHWYMIVAD